MLVEEELYYSRGEKPRRLFAEDEVETRDRLTRQPQGNHTSWYDTHSPFRGHVRVNNCRNQLGKYPQLHPETLQQPNLAKRGALKDVLLSLTTVHFGERDAEITGTTVVQCLKSPAFRGPTLHNGPEILASPDPTNSVGNAYPSCPLWILGIMDSGL
ncbi:hypothetical protein DL98DRAFT_534590 [Cadophora sp. DSE1049]|nr:hypothetical protein DL98DRAFT_534590 [Cadophora sp. DSE1049]